MTKPAVSKRRIVILAIAAAVICVSICPASLLAQSDELALKTNTASPRNVTELSLEKLIDLGRLPEAREKLREQVAKEGERPRLLLLEAMILYREQQHLESIRKLERSLSLHEGDADVYKLIGLNLVSVGKADLAEHYFEKAVALAPRDFMARYYLGLHHLTSKQFERAEAQVREALKLNPNYADAWLLLGVAQEHLGKETEAIQTYRQASELAERQNQKTETPSLYLARLLVSLQQFEQSLLPLKRAVALNPQSSESFMLLGRALSRLEQNEAALKVLTEAARLAPQDKAPHYLLISVYQKLGKTNEAQRERQIFRALEAKEKIND